jgi:hypothetical protein
VGSVLPACMPADFRAHLFRCHRWARRSAATALHAGSTACLWLSPATTQSFGSRICLVRLSCLASAGDCSCGSVASMVSPCCMRSQHACHLLASHCTAVKPVVLPEGLAPVRVLAQRWVSSDTVSVSYLPAWLSTCRHKGSTRLCCYDPCDAGWFYLCWIACFGRSVSPVSHGLFFLTGYLLLACMLLCCVAVLFECI